MSERIIKIRVLAHIHTHTNNMHTCPLRMQDILSHLDKREVLEAYLNEH